MYWLQNFEEQSYTKKTCTIKTNKTKPFMRMQNFY
jgi:hypothetical protein